MSPSEHKVRARATFSRKFGHLLGLVILAILAATIFALVQSPPSAEGPAAADRPVRIWRQGSQQLNQPIMVKAPGSGPLAKYFGSEIPLPPLPGIPAEKWETAQVVNVGQKDAGGQEIPVWEVTFDTNPSETVAGENIYLVKIDDYAGGVPVPTCPMDEIFVDGNGDKNENADVYGYRYLGAGAEEAANLAVDANNDDVPDMAFADIFTGTFVNTDNVDAGMIAAFSTLYGVTFSPSSGESTGPGQFYAFVSNGGTVIDPTACTAECGDGDVDDPEGCDPDTGTTSSAGLAMAASSECNDDCTPVDCGDTILNIPAGEECDDGNTSNHDSCTDSCYDAECGDGYVQPGEDCDDGGNSSADGCSPSCAWETGIGWDNCVNRDADLDVSNWPETICVSTCGDGVMVGLEYCDQGSSVNGNSDSCCDSDCTIRPSSYECRPSEGVCDVAEMCDGYSEFCGEDVVSDSSFVCNPAAGECDVEETCNGFTKDCPADVFKSSSETCGTNTGDECDLYESCTGTSASCPAPDYSNNNSSCGDDGNSCTNDLCQTGVCTHPSKTNGEDCPEGDSNDCTDFYCQDGTCADSNVSEGTSCGDLTNDWCYEGYCEVCGDVVDLNELCDDGNDASADGCTNCVVEDGWSCTNTLGEVSVCTPNCDTGSTCSASSDDNNSCTIPVCNDSNTCVEGGSGSAWNGNASAGASCSDDGEYCTSDTCDGSGNCEHPPIEDGTACSSLPNMYGELGVGHCSGGSCYNTCGDSSVQSWEECDEGLNNGETGFCCTDSCEWIDAGVECRAVAGDCDVAEQCTGSSGLCPADVFLGSETLCRASTGQCDLAETCSGSSASCSPQDYSNNNSSCSGDGNECMDFTCSYGSCTSANKADATICTDDDANECTGAYCQSGSCLDVPEGDGDLCGDWVNDACYSGTCEVCGSGGRGQYEACDDNNENNGDGCDTSCEVENLWSCTGDVGQVSVCSPDCQTGYGCEDTDGNECTVATCSDVFVCEQTGGGMAWNAYAGTEDPCTDDGEECTLDRCDGMGGCSHSSYPDGTTCNAVPNGHCYMGVCDDYCGDGVTDSWEQCDEGVNNGNADSCCSSTCQFKSAGETCRESAGICDMVESCHYWAGGTSSSGTCPTDAFAGSSSVCRVSMGECDLAESCDGMGVDCPGEDYSNNTSSCGNDGNECTVDMCLNGVCEHDAGAAEWFSCVDDDGNECTNSYCQSGTCADLSVANSPSSACGDFTNDWCVDGDCENCGDVLDFNEGCDDGGESGGDGCDANCEVEPGWSCTSTYGEVSVCTADCPTGNTCDDTDGYECTIATCSDMNSCEQSGSGTSWNAYASAGQSCSDDGEWCTYDECDGAGNCDHMSSVDNGVSCPSTFGGVPVDNGHCYGGVCGNYCGDGIVQDDALLGMGYGFEQCDEGINNGTITSCCSATCTFIANTETCREANGQCDVTEYCTGSAGSCPSDQYLDAHIVGYNSSTMCRPSADGGVCDPDDYCDGTSSSCPSDYNGGYNPDSSYNMGQVYYQGWTCTSADNWLNGYPEDNDCTQGFCNMGVCEQSSSLPDGSMCSYLNPDWVDPGNTGWCLSGTCYECGNGIEEPGEQCDLGSGNHSSESCCSTSCIFRDTGHTCRVANGICDTAETCSGGSATCPTDQYVAASASSCRAGTGECDPTEYCNGSSADCPSDVYISDYTSCTDDGNTCTDNYCYSGSCTSSNNSSFCTDSDGNTCTDGQCSGGTCVGQPLSEGASCPGGYCTSASSASIYCFAVPL